MPLIKLISGIRGTIGGQPGENLTPPDIVAFVSAFASQLKEQFANIIQPVVVVGRDGRISGPTIQELVMSTLVLNGIKVLDLGLATTPTVAMTVIQQSAQGGIIISASHNPQTWNALKFLNHLGEFLPEMDGQNLLALAVDNKFNFSEIDNLGSIQLFPTALDNHLQAIIDLPLVLVSKIKSTNFKIVVDPINSVGALAIPPLLKLLGVNNFSLINAEINGQFSHNPEPLDEHLSDIKQAVINQQADLGIVVDPDVDRLAFIDENGEMFGEEYTLVAIADYVLRNYHPCCYQKISVSNLSSSRALKDITEQRGGSHYFSAVGEANVVAKMKETGAAIGGEGNGGIIYPPLHYGRDALVGIALFLSLLADRKIKCSELKKALPCYFMIKDRLELTPQINLPDLLQFLRNEYQAEKITEIDGLKIDWPDSWVHLRASNTEPIIRIYGEGLSLQIVQQKIEEINRKILAYIK